MRFSGVNNQKKQCKCKKKPNLYQSISERKSFNNLLYKYRFLVKNCIHLIFVYLQIHLIVIPPKPEHWLNFVTIFKIHCVNTFDRAICCTSNFMEFVISLVKNIKCSWGKYMLQAILFARRILS